MSTEDDTFNNLRRIPFNDMRKLFIRHAVSVLYGGEPDPDLYEKNGWTKEEYIKVGNERLLKNGFIPYDET